MINTNLDKINVVIYGGGAIGCHIAYCLFMSGNKVYLISRGNQFKELKKTGLSIKIRRNNDLIKQSILTEQENFIILESVNKIDLENIDCLFITVKLKDFDKDCINNIKSFIHDNTAIVPPCTNIPLWWLPTIKNSLITNIYSNNYLDDIVNDYFELENIIGMTMWISAVVEKPGSTVVRHIQRGYPLKEISPKMKSIADKLRFFFNRTCISPEVQNIHSEIFSKSLNALAFNLVALDYEFTNLQLKKNPTAIEVIERIMDEGEQITKLLKIKLSQTAKERIDQTLSSSVHTMSMLNDYNNGKKTELKYLWLSFESIINHLNLKMNYTKSLVEKVLKKTE